MKILKVDLHIIGTIEIQEDEVTTKAQQEITFNPETDPVAHAMSDFMGKQVDGECKLEDCHNPAKVRGFCNKHYQVWYKTRKKVSA